MSVAIYVITHRESGKTYIGKTQFRVAIRWQRHVKTARNNPNTYIARAINKYGVNAFIVYQIAEAETHDEASLLEKFYIQLYRSHCPESGYNLTLGGDGNTANEATRQKISATHKRLGIKPPGCPLDKRPRGHSRPSEVRVKISAKQKGRPFSEERKLALRVPKSVPVWNAKADNRYDINISELIQLYQQGLSCANIAERLSTTESAIHWRLRKAGVEMRPVGFQKKIKEFTAHG